MQNNSPLRTLLITCAALVIIAFGVYAYLHRASVSDTASPTASTTSQTLSDGTVVSGLPEGATVQETVPLVDTIAAPDFRKPVAYNAAVSAEMRAAVETRRVEDVRLLTNNKYDFNAWMSLAGLYKIGGDYRGAEVVWLYATKVWPKSYVAFHNLGDLYQNFLKDSAKAQFYFDQAAKLGAPQQ